MLAYVTAYMCLFHVWWWAFSQNADLGWGLLTITSLMVFLGNIALLLERREKRLKRQKFQQTERYFGTYDPYVEREFYEIVSRPARAKNAPPKDDPGGYAVA